MRYIISMIVVFVLAALLMSGITRSQDIKPDIPLNTPIHFNNPTEKQESIVTNPDLMGHINREYEIREDILRYIERTIPTDNEVAKRAAIKYAQKWQFIYYKATKEEALKEANNQLVVLQCLQYAMHSNEPLPIVDGINKMMRDTKERDSHMWRIDQDYFSWQVIGHETLNDDELKEVCEKGDY